MSWDKGSGDEILLFSSVVLRTNKPKSKIGVMKSTELAAAELERRLQLYEARAERGEPLFT